MDVQVRTLAEKSCNDCHTTTTPLWRAGPDGPRSLCNACGLRYRKRRKAMLGLGRGGPKKSKKRNRTRRGHEVGVSLNKAVIDFGRKMDQPYNLHERQCNLKDEEEAATLLMALSCGSLCAFTN